MTAASLFPEGYCPPTRRKGKTTETPPFPVPPVPLGLSWAWQEQELLQRLPEVRKRLRKAVKVVRDFRRLGASADLLHTVSKRREKLRYEAWDIATDLVWVKRALSAVGAEDPENPKTP